MHTGRTAGDSGALERHLSPSRNDALVLGDQEGRHLRRGAVADREDALLATTHRPDSRSATRRIRNKSVAEGVTLPEV
jgi:hypothetical protein